MSGNPIKLITANNNDYFKSNRITHGTSVPTSGSRVQGDLHVNVGSNQSEIYLWVCVETGTPGRWVPIKNGDTVPQEVEDLVGKFGDLNNLTTEHKLTLVGAINEVVTKIKNIDVTNDIKTYVGDKTQLSTTNKDNLVAAINELFQNANNGKETIATAIGSPLQNSDTFAAMGTKINAIEEKFRNKLKSLKVDTTDSPDINTLIDKVDKVIEKDPLIGLINKKAIIPFTSGFKTESLEEYTCAERNGYVYIANYQSTTGEIYKCKKEDFKCVNGELVNGMELMTTEALNYYSGICVDDKFVYTNNRTAMLKTDILTNTVTNFYTTSYSYGSTILAMSDGYIYRMGGRGQSGSSDITYCDKIDTLTATMSKSITIGFRPYSCYNAETKIYLPQNKLIDKITDTLTDSIVPINTSDDFIPHPTDSNLIIGYNQTERDLVSINLTTGEMIAFGLPKPGDTYSRNRSYPVINGDMMYIIGRYGKVNGVASNMAFYIEGLIK